MYDKNRLGGSPWGSGGIFMRGNRVFEGTVSEFGMYFQQTEVAIYSWHTKDRPIGGGVWMDGETGNSATTLRPKRWARPK